MTERQFKKRIAGRLKYFREYNKFTQQQVAKNIKLSRVSIMNVEAGRHQLKPFKFLQLCQLYKCTPNDIYLGMGYNMQAK